MAEESEIVIGGGSTAFVGADATKYYAARQLQSALRMYGRSGMQMTRVMTLGRMLESATSLTRKKYPRSRAGAAKASEDVGAWADAMLAGLPITDRTKEAAA